MHDKVDILETKLKCSEEKYDALLDSYRNDISRVKND